MMNMLTHAAAVRALNALLLTLAVTGCSKAPSAQSGPLVIAPTQTVADRTLRSSITSDNMETKYIAKLKNGRIAQIEETRSASDGRSAKGAYTFFEARLIKYSGDGINATGHEEVEFDLHGAIKRSQAGSGSLSLDEVAAIRNRAELLRSHALTQKEVQAHHTD
jgi:hypothetical protein